MFHLPKMGLTMDEATVTRWLKEPGDAVAEGEAVLEVETDKAVLEVESPVSGYLRLQMAESGERVALGAAMATFSSSPDEAISPDGAASEPATTPTKERVAPQSRPRDALPTAPVDGNRFKASPSIRRRAREYGIDLTEIAGTGPHGRIRMHDLEQALLARRSEETPAAPRGTVQAMSRARLATARRMVESARDIPQFTLRRKVDLGGAVRLRALVNPSLERSGITLSVTDFLLQAIAEGLMAHPAMRSALVGTLDAGRVAVAETANLGLAVEGKGGLLVPVLEHMESLSLVETARMRREAVAMARDGKLSGKFMQAASFTLSNLGPFDVDEFHALVNPGEAGILAVGRVQEETISLPQGPVQRQSLVLTFTFDHRLVDGADGARFAASVADALQSDSWRLV
ncbi:MAG: dihydrolipoamide acetyltransferase family protein [Thermaerobacter sp.]|nr:dihydrolipoamide acetyltransferase family protein [Thermaerobacter sp.]